MSDELYLSVATIYCTGITSYLQGARQTNILIRGSKALLCQMLYKSHFFVWILQFGNLLIKPNHAKWNHRMSLLWNDSLSFANSHTAADVGRSSLFHHQTLLVETPVHVGNSLSYYQLHHCQSNLQASLRNNTIVCPFLLVLPCLGFFLVLFLKGSL